MLLAEKHGLRGYDALQLAAGVEVDVRYLASGLPAVIFISADTELTVIFAYNRPVSFTTLPVNIGTGWTKMTVSVGMSYGGSITGYALRIPVVAGVITQDPTDNINWMEQIRVACDGGVGCPVITIPVISEFYEFSTGTSSGNVTAAAVVEK